MVYKSDKHVCPKCKKPLEIIDEKIKLKPTTEKLSDIKVEGKCRVCNLKVIILDLLPTGF